MRLHTSLLTLIEEHHRLGYVVPNSSRMRRLTLWTYEVAISVGGCVVRFGTDQGTPYHRGVCGTDGRICMP